MRLNSTPLATGLTPRSRILLAGGMLLCFLSFAPRSHAALITYLTTLSGPAESPPNASPGTGSAEVDFDPVAHTLRVRESFTGLLGTTTASHIHSATPTPGTGTAIVATMVPTFSAFPLGVTSGTFDQTLDTTQLSTYNPAFVTANGGTASSAETALAASLAAGTSYLNIHTSLFPTGEIRGFLVPAAAVPLPAGAYMGLLALPILGLWVWKKRDALA